MAQSGNPGGELRCVSDIPTQKCEGLRGLRSDRVGLRMTETEKYKLGLRLVVVNPSDTGSSFAAPGRLWNEGGTLHRDGGTWPDQYFDLLFNITELYFTYGILVPIPCAMGTGTD